MYVRRMYVQPELPSADLPLRLPVAETCFVMTGTNLMHRLISCLCLPRRYAKVACSDAPAAKTRSGPFSSVSLHRPHLRVRLQGNTTLEASPVISTYVLQAAGLKISVISRQMGLNRRRLDKWAKQSGCQNEARCNRVGDQQKHSVNIFISAGKPAIETDGCCSRKFKA
jgi:hypothetical protein